MGHTSWSADERGRIAGRQVGDSQWGVYGGICVEQMRINTGSSAPGARSARARRG